MKDFAPKEIRHIVREDNIVTNCLLRLDMECRTYNLIETEKACKLRLQYCNMIHRMTKYAYNLKEVIKNAPFLKPRSLLWKGNRSVVC